MRAVASPEIEAPYRLLAQAIIARASQTHARGTYIVAISGSVAVGKSTTAQLLKSILQHFAPNLRLEVVCTDGFLYPNRVLRELGLMQRKGFPESYDSAHLIECLEKIKTTREPVPIPVYDHAAYDVVTDRVHILDSRDIVILEGVNVLPASERGSGLARWIDFSIYLDADERDIEAWYIARTLALRVKDGGDPVQLSEQVRRIWREINLVNLRDHILPGHAHADAILYKSGDHGVQDLVFRGSPLLPESPSDV
jgi:type I pantothenate kinase